MGYEPITKVTALGEVNLLVSRPAKGIDGEESTEIKSGWELKIVHSAHDNCKLNADAHFAVTDNWSTRDYHFASVDEKEFKVTVQFSGTTMPLNGNYTVCFRPDDDRAWRPIPGRGSQFLTVSIMGAGPRGLFLSQSTSVRAGQMQEVHLAGSRLHVPSENRFALSNSTEGCSQSVRLQPFARVVSPMPANLPATRNPGVASLVTQSKVAQGNVDVDDVIINTAQYNRMGMVVVAGGADRDDRPTSGVAYTAYYAETVEGIATGDTVTVTVTAHGFSLNDPVVLHGVESATELNGVMFYVHTVAANTFTLRDATGSPLSVDAAAKVTRKTTVSPLRTTGANAPGKRWHALQDLPRPLKGACGVGTRPKTTVGATDDMEAAGELQRDGMYMIGGVSEDANGNMVRLENSAYRLEVEQYCRNRKLGTGALECRSTTQAAPKADGTPVTLCTESNGKCGGCHDFTSSDTCSGAMNGAGIPCVWDEGLGHKSVLGESFHTRRAVPVTAVARISGTRLQLTAYAHGFKTGDAITITGGTFDADDVRDKVSGSHTVVANEMHNFFIDVDATPAADADYDVDVAATATVDSCRDCDNGQCACKEAYWTVMDLNTEGGDFVGVSDHCCTEWDDDVIYVTGGTLGAGLKDGLTCSGLTLNADSAAAKTQCENAGCVYINQLAMGDGTTQPHSCVVGASAMVSKLDNVDLAHTDPFDTYLKAPVYTEPGSLRYIVPITGTETAGNGFKLKLSLANLDNALDERWDLATGYVFGITGATLFNDQTYQLDFDTSDDNTATAKVKHAITGQDIPNTILTQTCDAATITNGFVVFGPRGGLTGHACTKVNDALLCMGGVVGTVDQTASAACQGSKTHCQAPPPYGCGGMYDEAARSCMPFMNEQILLTTDAGLTRPLLPSDNSVMVGVTNAEVVTGDRLLAVARASVTNNVATITTRDPHGLTTGDWVEFTDDASPVDGEADGEHQVTVVNSRQVTFALTDGDEVDAATSGYLVVRALYLVGGTNAQGVDTGAVLRVTHTLGEAGGAEKAFVSIDNPMASTQVAVSQYALTGLPPVPCVGDDCHYEAPANNNEIDHREYLLIGGHQAGQLVNTVRKSYVGLHGFVGHADTMRGFGVDSVLSEAGKHVLQVETPEGTNGVYRLCMCNAHWDNFDTSEDVASTATGFGNHLYRYKFYESKTGGNQMAIAGFEADLCWDKCIYGCSGANCFCEGLESGDDTDTKAWCLDHAGLRKACEDHNQKTGAVWNAKCVGYAMHKTKPRGWLLTSSTDTFPTPGTDNADYDSWVWAPALQDTPACSENGMYHGQASDFAPVPAIVAENMDYFDSNPRDGPAGPQTVGTMTVTNRADVGVDYVVTPNQESSLEVTGDNLNYHYDRIMVVDCHGSCGSAAATTAATLPTDVTSWAGLAPVNTFLDRPSLATDSSTADTVVGATVSFQVTEMSYCPSNNVKAMGHSEPLVANHQCYHKCFEQAPCHGDNCFCDGHFAGFDGPDSDALCLDRRACEDLCKILDDCSSVDMHRTANRCFLNSNTRPTGVTDGEYGTCAIRAGNTQAAPNCAAHADETACDADVSCVFADGACSSVGTLGTDANYNFLMLTEDQNTARRLSTAGQARALLAGADPRTSWGSILRFTGVTFTRGGTYKVCLCDSGLRSGKATEHYHSPESGPSNNLCVADADFTVEVGTVHASGLQCLLGDKRFQRGVCESQEYGGLRCYGKGEAPEVLVDEAFLAVPALDAQRNFVSNAVIDQVADFCKFGPTTEVAAFQYCTKFMD